MGVSKIVFGDTVLIDLTGDTVTAATLDKGATAHDKAGNQIVGTMEAGESIKFGATLDTFLGDVDSNGVLQAPSAETNLVFSGVTDIGDSSLKYRYHGTNINSASFTNLTQITGRYALNRAFYSSSIRFVSFPVLQSLSGANCLSNAFTECNSLQSIEFPSLVSISGNNALDNMCSNSRDAITSISFPVLKEITGKSACSRIAYTCSSLTSVTFPELETITGDTAFQNAFYSCQKLKSILFPKLKTIGSSTENSLNYGQFSYALHNTPITSLEFPELTEIYCTGFSTSCGTFYGNDRIQKMYFPKLSVIAKSPAYSSSDSTAQNYIFGSCYSLTEIHFGAANQAAIEAKKNAPKREKTCYFERSKMKRDAARLAKKPRTPKNQTKGRSKKQGIE